MSWGRSIGARVVHRRHGSGGSRVLCAGVFALAVERSAQVRLLPDCGAAGFVAEGDASRHLDATLSVNFLFTLLGILELGLPETLLIVLASTLGQAYRATTAPGEVGAVRLQLVAADGVRHAGLRRLRAGGDARSARARTAGSSRRRHHPLRLQHGGHVDHHWADRR